MPPASKARSLESLKRRSSPCKHCSEGRERPRYVFGTGDPEAKLVFIGEAPGLQEDRQGIPFVGRSGQLLTKLIESIGLTRDEVYITNVVKCHPMKDPTQPDKRGNDRKPTKDEVAACLPVLERQLEIIKPGVIVTLGNSPTQALLDTKEGITTLRGTFVDYKGTKLLPTYHPAAVLRNPNLREVIQQDFQRIKKELEK